MLFNPFAFMYMLGLGRSLSSPAGRKPEHLPVSLANLPVVDEENMHRLAAAAGVTPFDLVKGLIRWAALEHADELREGGAA